MAPTKAKPKKEGNFTKNTITSKNFKKIEKNILLHSPNEGKKMGKFSNFTGLQRR